MKTWLQKYYPLLLILITAIGLRINLLFARGTFWFDEIFSTHYALLPWSEALKYWWLETNPPLHTFFLRGWLTLFGESEIIARLPSLFFALLTIAVLYLWAQKLFSRRLAIIASIFVALSGIHLFVSTEARTYSLLTLLALISMYFYYQTTEKPVKKITWWWYGISQTLLLYSHLTAVAIPLIQLIHGFSTADQETKKKLIKTNFIVFVVWCLWFIPFIISKFNTGTTRGWFFNYNTDSSNILTTFVTLLLNANLSATIFTILSLTLIIIFAIFSKNYLQIKNKKMVALLILWVTIPIICGNLLGMFITKYFVFVLPAFAFLIAIAINELKNKSAILVVTLLLLSIILPATLTVSNSRLYSWYSYTEYLEKNGTKNSIIFTIPFNEELSLKKYYQGNIPIKGIYPFNDDLSLEERIVRYNWQTLIGEDEILDQWLDEHTAGRDKIFLFKYSYEPDWVVNWLQKNGWQTYYIKKPRDHIMVYLFEFHAPDFNTTTSTSSSRTEN